MKHIPLSRLTHWHTALKYALSIIAITCLAACRSDKPTWLEPHLTTLAATDITRTQATLNGTISIEGETTMPQLHFRYGTAEDMPLTTSAVSSNNSQASAILTGLTAGTTYYYTLQGRNGEATIGSNTMTFTTLPNEKPSLGDAYIISHGPMSAIIGYDITDDGGENITETGCLYAPVTSDEQQRITLTPYQGQIGSQKLLLDHLERNTTYHIWPYAKSRAGETTGQTITFTTTDAISLSEAGQLQSLMESNLYNYTTLSIAGPLNGDDLSCLRMMIGRNPEGDATPGHLSHIDLTDAKIIAGGDPYDASRYSKDHVIGQGLFSDCTQLVQISLPTDATTIEKDAFFSCTSLTQIEISASVSSILPSGGCKSLGNIHVSGANAHYKSIDGVLLNNDATQIVWFPMGKESSYTLPATISTIGNYAFKECSISTFTFPDHLKEIGQGAFMDSKVREVTLPASLKLIPTSTFQGCTQLSIIRMGSLTEFISDYAFDQCPLTDIYIEATTPPMCSAQAFSTHGADIFSTCKVHVPKGTAAAYRASDGWSLFKNITTR